jgi:hypothetical protein
MAASSQSTPTIDRHRCSKHAYKVEERTVASGVDVRIAVPAWHALSCLGLHSGKAPAEQYTIRQDDMSVTSAVLHVQFWIGTW